MTVLNVVPTPQAVQGIRQYEDRSIAVPEGARVVAEYVSVNNVRFAGRDRMAVGDVDKAYQRRLQLAGEGCQPWPPPRGYWEKDTFVLVDGRHDYVAALMLGQEWILVAWVEEVDPPLEA